ncbi:MAG: DNA replication/repair protein RecF [Moorella sp. (in: firmicutes)]
MPDTRLADIQLINFRSYRSLLWHCEPGLNIIYGPNGVGKTNLLEAIAYLSFARSFRQQQDRFLVTWEDSFFQISGCCLYNQEKIKVDINIIYRDGHKELTINGQTNRLIDLLGIFPVIYFGPDDLLLLKGAPVLRRQFLDREISTLDRIYCRNLQLYRRLLLQRNRLLRAVKDERAKLQELEPWTLQLINIGTAIIQQRHAFINSLATLAADIYKKMGGREDLALVYRPNVGSMDEWMAKFKSGREREIQAGLSLWGPHRDDFSFSIGNRDARHFASQGQQRAAVLALKIAETMVFFEVLGKKPALLMDDVFSELDLRRREALLELLFSAGQSFITTTELSNLPSVLLDGAAIWQLNSDGRLILEQK